MRATKFVLIAVAVILALDFVVMIAWAVSGQAPADSFFIGSMSRWALSHILF